MDAAKLEKILLLLSSDQPGEVFSAVQAIGRQLQAHNLDWHAFAKMVAGRLADKNAKPEEPPHTAPPFTHERHSSATISAAEATMVEEVFMGLHRIRLNEKERGFIESLRDRVENYGNRTFISPAQRKWLQDIWERMQ